MLKAALAAGVTALLTLVMVSPAVAEECSQAAQSSGACVRVTTTLDSSGVTVGANGLTPGTPGSATSPLDTATHFVVVSAATQGAGTGNLRV
jgi:hypothetical protein